MVFFKTKNGELIPFTAPLLRELFTASWPEETIKHRAFRLTCHGVVVYSYATSNHRNLAPLADTIKSYVYEAIQSCIEDGDLNIIIDVDALAEGLE